MMTAFLITRIYVGLVRLADQKRVGNDAVLKVIARLNVEKAAKIE